MNNQIARNILLRSVVFLMVVIVVLLSIQNKCLRFKLYDQQEVIIRLLKQLEVRK